MIILRRLGDIVAPVIIADHSDGNVGNSEALIKRRQTDLTDLLAATPASGLAVDARTLPPPAHKKDCTGEGPTERHVWRSGRRNR